MLCSLCTMHYASEAVQLQRVKQWIVMFSLGPRAVAVRIGVWQMRTWEMKERNCVIWESVMSGFTAAERKPKVAAK